MSMFDNVAVLSSEMGESMRKNRGGTSCGKTVKRICKGIAVTCLAVFVLVLYLFPAIMYWDYRGLEINKKNNPFQHLSSSKCLPGKRTDVHIAYITDSNYLYPTQVAVYSAIKNKCPDNVYHFHILTDDVPQQVAEEAFKPFAQKDVDFDIVPQVKTLDIEFSDFLEHISSAAMLKFTIAEALPKVDRVIYMDSDTLVVKDLAELFNQDLDGYILGAVSDIATMAQPGYLATIGYREKDYFNSGMLLLDLNKMRQAKVGQNLNEYVLRNQNLIFIDQDAYNVVLRKKIKKLPYKYNCMTTLHFERYKSVSFWKYLAHRMTSERILSSNFLALYKDELPLFYRNLFRDVVVFHYFGFSKPWRGKVKKESFQVFYDLWHKYSEDLANEYGIKRGTISNVGKKRTFLPDIQNKNMAPLKQGKKNTVIGEKKR